MKIVDARQPWWQDRATARAAFVLGGGFLAIALVLLGLVLFAHDSDQLPLAVGWLVVSAVSFAVGITRRRRERSRHGSDMQ
jgi:drug/metabolite transporter (DMT)-like permease